jgi:CBS domain containing-hemolysin-like protein
MTGLFVLIFGILISSGLCSMTEAAILSLPHIKARTLFERKVPGSRDLLYIKDNIHIAVATIVIINNSINIVGSIFVGRLVTDIFGSHWLGVASAILTFAIIIISEVIPKTIGEHYKVKVSLGGAKILKGLIILFKPVVFVVSFLSHIFRGKSKLPNITEEEIKAMLRLGMKEGTVEVDEEVLCNRVFRLNDLKASSMMKPIDKVYALEGNKELIEIKDAVIDSPYSRIVVYDKDIKKIIGICQQRALLRELSKDNYHIKIKDNVMSPIYVYENERADTLLSKFQAYRQHLFIVRDYHGRNIGIISMEDVLEELFGEIYDEKDTARRIH